METMVDMFKRFGLSEDDFLYDFNSDIFYHWSGLSVTAEALEFSTPERQFNKWLSQHLETLSESDKNEKRDQLRTYQKHYLFILDFKDWLFNKIIEEMGLAYSLLTDFDKRQELYREKRCEYINGWEPGKIWHPKDLTDKVPRDLKQKAIEAWDYVLDYRAMMTKIDRG